MTTLRFWPGEAVRVDVAFTDGAGAAMAATGVTITAKPPTGEPISGTVQAGEGQGRFFAIFPVSVPGLWAVRAACTGPTPSAVEDRFEVAPSYVL